ncbi:MAG: hypothetical protein V1487_02345 [bacterium]
MRRDKYTDNMMNSNDGGFAIDVAGVLQRHGYDLSNSTLKEFWGLTEAFYGQSYEWLASMVVRSVYLWTTQGSGELSDTKVTKFIKRAEKEGQKYAKQHNLRYGDDAFRREEHSEFYWPVLQGMMIEGEE